MYSLVSRRNFVPERNGIDPRVQDQWRKAKHDDKFHSLEKGLCNANFPDSLPLLNHTTQMICNLCQTKKSVSIRWSRGTAIVIRIISTSSRRAPLIYHCLLSWGDYHVYYPVSLTSNFGKKRHINLGRITARIALPDFMSELILENRSMTINDHVIMHTCTIVVVAYKRYAS